MMFREQASGRPVPVDVRSVVLAGYTGRDQDAVRRHVEELAAHGVPAPARVPAFYRVTPDRVVQTDRVAMLGDATSGEAEFVLFRADGEMYVGVGSDHTDREAERTSVRLAKQLCSKVVAADVWRLADVAAHWDHVALRSHVGEERADRPYQDGAVTDLLDPEEIFAMAASRGGGDESGLLVFSGTLSLLGELEFSRSFAAELSDEEHGLRIVVEYRVEVCEPLD